MIHLLCMDFVVAQSLAFIFLAYPISFVLGPLLSCAVQFLLFVLVKDIGP